MDLCITGDPFTSAPSNAVFSPILAPISTTLTFHLLIHNPLADSPLTGPWDVPAAPLVVPRAATRDQLLATLRDRLPPLRARVGRQPKLGAAVLYLTFRGEIVPLAEDAGQWFYRNAITKTDLARGTEADWAWIKEMLAGSEGGLKCYVAIQAQQPQERKKGWWSLKRESD